MKVNGEILALPRAEEIPGSGRSSIKRRIIIGLYLAGFVIAFCSYFFFGAVGHAIGFDFPAFYLAGKVPLNSLYDQNVFQNHGIKELSQLSIHYYPPYIRPAAFAVALKALASLPYWQAFTVWYVLQFCAYAGLVFLLYRRYPIPIELLPVLGFFAPAAYGPVFGQDPNTLAVILLVSLILLLEKRERAAGLLLSLGIYKFNIILLIPVFLLIKRRYLAFRWMCFGSMTLALASGLISSPFSYIHLLQTLRQYQIGTVPLKYISLRSVAFALDMPPLFYFMAAGVVAWCLWVLHRFDLPEAFSIAVLGSILIAPHCGGYDATCVLLPIFQVFRSGQRNLQIVAATLLVLFPIWPAWVNALLLLVLFIGISRWKRPKPLEIT